MNRIAYQGVKGAFSYITALKAFGHDNSYIGLPSFKEVFEHLECGKADYAVLPIENSLIGAIYENYDLMNLYEMRIIGEHYTKIEHCLLTHNNDQMKTIKKVLSHPKALEQCSRFFQEHPWMEAVVYMDTAAAAAEVASKKDSTWAAIASANAAELYELKILKKGIEDDPKNYTRFVTITKRETKNEVDKCTFLLKLRHVPGALAELLRQFADKEINLTKIESRPLRGSPFEYLFYVEFEFSAERKHDVENLLSKLNSKVKQLKILGFYKRGILWS